MKIILAGETSGHTREAFRARGHDAWSCDLLPSVDSSPFHVIGDMFEILYDGNWDMMIAHPTCTYLTISAEWAYADVPMIKGKPRKMKPGTLIGAARRAARAEALDDVRRLFLVPIKRKCIENPAGKISTEIRPANQYIQPNQFGHDASKTTGLWLENLPLLVPTKFIEPRWVCCGLVLPDGVGKYGCPNCLGEKKPLPRWANQTDAGQNRLPPSKDRWKKRSVTYPGISDAMAQQWGNK